MTSLLPRTLLGAALLALSSLAPAQSLQVLGAAPDVKELDLYQPSAERKYLKSVEVGSLSFPIAVKQEQALGFIITLDGSDYYVGASDVSTNKVYDTTALNPCDGGLAYPTGASRGIAGQGCK